PTAADVRNDRGVLQLRSRGARAGELVLLFVLSDCGIEIPTGAEHAGVAADHVVAAGLVRSFERAGRSGDAELRAGSLRWVADDRGVDQLIRGEREAQLARV